MESTEENKAGAETKTGSANKVGSANTTGYAVIKTGGKQYRVSAGETLRIEKLAGAVGDVVTFGEVLLIAAADGAGTGEGAAALQIGRPLLAGAAVEAKITAQDREKKIIIFKFRRRKNYRRKTGHRQPFTAVLITGIRSGKN